MVEEQSSNSSGDPKAVIPRSDLDAKVAAWAARSDAPRFLFVSGAPGTGKTVWARSLAGSTSTIRASHFCRANALSSLSPVRFLESVAEQFARRSAKFCEALALSIGGRRGISIRVDQSNASAANIVGVHLEFHDANAEDIVSDLLAVPLNIVADDSEEPWIVLVDGLDEAEQYSGQITIAQLLLGLATLPGKVRFILTSRAHPVLEQRFAGAGADFMALENLPGSRAAVQAYAMTALTEPAISARIPQNMQEETQKALAEKAGSNFLLASCYLATLRDSEGEISPISFDGLPSNVPGVYFELLSRRMARGAVSWRDSHAPMVRLLAVANEPLTERQIAAATGVSPSHVRSAISELRQFLQLSDPRDGEVGWAIYHQSFADFLVDKDAAGSFWCPPDESHECIVRWALDGERKASRIDWKSTDKYLLRHFVFHLFSAGQQVNTIAGIEEALSSGFLAVRLEQQNGLTADLRTISEELEWRTKDRAGWLLRLRAALARAAVRSRITWDRADLGQNLADELTKARELEAPKRLDHIILSLGGAATESPGRMQLIQFAIESAHEMQGVSPLIRVAAFATESDRDRLLQEALRRARRETDVRTRVMMILEVARFDLAQRNDLEQEALSEIEDYEESAPDVVYEAIASSLTDFSVTRQRDLWDRLAAILPRVRKLKSSDKLNNLFELNNPPQYVVDKYLHELAKRIGDDNSDAFAFRNHELRQIVRVLAPLSSTDAISVLIDISVSAGIRHSDQFEDLLNMLQLAGLHRLPIKIWRRVVDILAHEPNGLNKRNAIAYWSVALPDELLSTVLSIAQNIGGPGDCDRIDAEVALLFRMEDGPRKQFATELLAHCRSSQSTGFLTTEWDRTILLLEAILSERLPPRDAWYASSPGAVRTLEHLRIVSDESQMAHAPDTDWNWHSAMRENVRFAEGTSDTPSMDSRPIQNEEFGATPPPKLTKKIYEEVQPSVRPRSGDVLETESASFDCLISLADLASDTERAAILSIARERAISAADVDLRWDRLKRILKLPGNRQDSDTISALSSICEENPSSASRAAGRWAELCLITGDGAYEAPAIQQAFSLPVKESVGGSYSGEELTAAEDRASIFLTLAAAAILRGAPTDDLVLNSSRALLMFSGDRLYRFSALRYCAELLSSHSLLDAVRLAENRDACVHARAEFLHVLARVLEDEQLLIALEAAKTIPDEYERSFATGEIQRHLTDRDVQTAESPPKKPTGFRLRRRGIANWILSGFVWSHQKHLRHETTPSPTQSDADDSTENRFEKVIQCELGLDSIAKERFGGLPKRLAQSVSDARFEHMRSPIAAHRPQNEKNQPETVAAELDRLCEPNLKMSAQELLTELACAIPYISSIRERDKDLVILANDVVFCSRIACGSIVYD